MVGSRQAAKLSEMKLVGEVFFPVHALILYSSPYDSDITVLFEKNMENIKNIRSFHLRPGGKT